MIEIGFFICGLIAFIAMSLTLAFTIFLYIRLVVAVKNNREVPKWMYSIGHALKGRGADIYEDFTDKYALNEVNLYILGVVIASIATYFIFYDKYFPGNKVRFWTYAELLIIVAMRAILSLVKLLLSHILPTIKKSNYICKSSAAANAVIGMLLMSIFACTLTFMLTGLPVKAPTVQVDGYEIVIGHTTAKNLLSNGFHFSGRNPSDTVENKRESFYVFGETAELVKDGKGYGDVNLIPKYQDKAKLEDCIITYFGTTSKTDMINHVKICNQNISELSPDCFEKENVRDVFSLSPISYQEQKVKGHYSIKMQTYPYILWKSYDIEVIFSSDDRPNQFEVYARHTLWE